MKVFRKVEKVEVWERQQKGWNYKKTQETKILDQATFPLSFNSNVEGERRVVYQASDKSFWVLEKLPH